MNRWMEFGAKNKDYFTRNHKFSTDNELKKFLKKYNYTDCYTSVYSYDNETPETSNLVGDFYIDFDATLLNNEDYNKLKDEVILVVNYFKYNWDIDEKNILLFYSGAKGFHLIIPHQVFSVQPIPCLNILYRMLTEKIVNIGKLSSCDLKIYDNRRLFRIPNTINSKTGLYKIYISLEELKKSSLEVIFELAKGSREIPFAEVVPSKTASIKFHSLIQEYEAEKTRIPARKKTEFVKQEELYIPPCVEYIMNNGAPTGTRNNSLAFLSSYFMQNGYSYDETYNILGMWNESFNDEKIKQSEFDATIKSIFNGKHVYGCLTAKVISECKSTCKYRRK